MKAFLFCFFGLMTGGASLAQTTEYNNCRQCFPFSKNVKYVEAANPDLSTITTDTLRILFKNWERDYLVHLPDGTAYVKNDEQKQKEDGLTTSEANGYGMVIEVLMAGCLPNSQQNFDALYAYARKHHIASAKPKDGFTSPYLMSWKQYPGKKADEKDAAVDGDLDMAYALLLASVQWRDTSHYNYLDCARKTLHDLMLYETDVADKRFERGSADQLDVSKDGYHFLRTSDFMPVNIRAFAAFTVDSDFWKAFLKANYDRFKVIQAQESPQYGLFPDYVYETKPGDLTVITDANKNLARHQHLDDGGRKENHFGAYYGFNACRVPWRIGLDYLLTGEPDAKLIIDKLNAGIKRYAEDSVSMLSNVLRLSDTRDPAAHHRTIDSASNKQSADLNVVGPLAIAAMADPDIKWRTRLFQLMTDQRSTMCFNANPDSLGHHDHYEHTIRLICDLIITHHYWTPDPADLPKP